MMTGRTPANTQYLNIEPQSQMYSKPYMEQFSGEAHKLEHFSQADDPLIERLPVGKVGRGVVGSTVAGIVPSVIADLVVDKLAPEDQGGEAKKAEKAIAASGLTRIISPMAGVGAAGIADTLLPIYAGMQAGDISAKAVDRTLPESTSTKARRAIEGATAGAAHRSTARCRPAHHPAPPAPLPLPAATSVRRVAAGVATKAVGGI